MTMGNEPVTSHTELDLLSHKEKYYMLLKCTLAYVISFLLLENFCERGLKKSYLNLANFV